MSEVVPTNETAATLKAQADDAAAEGETFGSFAKFVLKLVIAVLIFRIFLFSPFNIPSESMLPRLMNGDYLLASKWSYGFSKHSFWPVSPPWDGRILAGQPERGDVVIFKHPVDGVDYIKRVIALPGDTIAMRDGVPILNGEALPREQMDDFIVHVSPNTSCAWGAVADTTAEGEEICRYRRYRETLPGGRTYQVLDFGTLPQDNYRPAVVGEGEMFLMGDNRDNSQDSRFRAQAGGGLAMVPQELLVGEAQVIVWSTDGGAEWIKPWTWFTAARWGRIGDGL